MATGYGEVVARVYERLLDWLDDCANTGGSVTNLALDLINRSQEELRKYKRWHGLVTTAELTVSSKQASFPSDCGEVISIFEDSDADGYPDKFWYNWAKRSDEFCYFRDAFTKITGHTRTVHFQTAPSNTVYMKYVKTLDDFVATNVDTSDPSDSGYADAYSFFPNALLLVRAQLIHAYESGVPDATELNALEKRFIDLITDYTQADQNVAMDPRLDFNDDSGLLVDVESYDLLGGTSHPRSVYGNDYDHG